jgi:GxxExxY protein
MLVEGTVLLELKAVESLSAVHVTQILSYLKAGRFPVGLLINFNVPVLKTGIRRFLWNA